MNEKNQQLSLVLFLLRIGVAIVFIMWTGNKFFNPTNAQDVWSGFFFMPEVGKIIFLSVGIAEAILVFLFITGLFKSFSYLAIMVIHTFSTLAPYEIYLNPYGGGPNLLFFAAFPMLAACFALYKLRAYDTKFTIKF